MDCKFKKLVDHARLFYFNNLLVGWKVNDKEENNSKNMYSCYDKNFLKLTIKYIESKFLLNNN
jgi:hypothetical protein